MPKSRLGPEYSFSWFPQPSTHTSTIHITPPATASLINYIPSFIGGTFQTTYEDAKTDFTSSKSSLPKACTEEPINVGNIDERGKQLWQVCKDEAGAWTSHRFTLYEWETPETDKSKATRKHEKTQPERLDSFDGYLTKEIVASGLSRVDRCPVLYHYSYTKCVLSKKVGNKENIEESNIMDIQSAKTKEPAFLRLIDIEALGSYHYLQYVDVSGNKLTTLKALGNLPFLKYLDASHNLLTTILDFKVPYFLTTVDLAYNKFKVIRDLKDFWSITDFNLSHNNIRAISGLSELSYLSTLNLSFNKIEKIENLKGLRIQILNLKNNEIKSFDGHEKAMLYTLSNLRIINLSHNQVSSLKMFESVENLECLDIPSNNISQLIDIYYLRNLKYLSRLNLIGNSVTNLRRYVEVCVTNIRNLVYLDGEHINNEFWLLKLSNAASDENETAANERLKLLILEQLNKPQIWDWLLPYDNPPLAIIVLVGLQGSRRAHIARKFCRENDNVVVGIQYTTRPKHPDETQGEHYYYINEEEFITMLKEGKFLTYQEHLGFYFGFAHSEFRKAEQGILLFHTDLTMALVIRSRFFDTKMILTLPSTRAKHLYNLRKLYATRLLDIGTTITMKSRKSSVFTLPDSQTDLYKQRNPCLEVDVKIIVNDLVRRISFLEQEFPETKIEPGIWQLWTASRESLAEEKNQSQPQMNKFVSFTGAESLKVKTYNSEYVQHEIEGNVRTGIGDDPVGLPSAQSKPSANFDMGHSCSDTDSYDAMSKAIFDVELNMRDELLELHWAMPGLFRDLLFTDLEAETMEKLKLLVKDVVENQERKGMFNFENDETFKILSAAKIKKCFVNLQRELSVSEKQAAEYFTEEDDHICGSTACSNPACPPF